MNKLFKKRVICHTPVEINGINFLVGDTFDVIDSKMHANATINRTFGLQYPSTIEIFIYFKGKEYSFNDSGSNTMEKGIISKNYFTMYSLEKYREIILNKLLIS